MRIVKAAVFHHGQLFTGRDHGICIRDAYAFDQRRVAQAEQGFLTDEGTFVGREAAARIAFHAGQVRTMLKWLSSEDLTWDRKKGEFAVLEFPIPGRFTANE